MKLEKLARAVKTCIASNGCYNERDKSLCTLSDAGRNVPCEYLDKERTGNVKLYSASGGWQTGRCFGCSYSPEQEEVK